MVWRSLLVNLLPAVLCCGVFGCGSSDGTVRVSGKVTFKGTPVPAGKIYFMPDGSKGNAGPTGFADIKNGEYDTSATGGRNPTSGPVIIAIEGLDPSAPPDKPKKGETVSEEATAKLLFARYETTADLPKSASTKDIDVPAEASKGPVAPKQPAGAIIP